MVPIAHPALLIFSMGISCDRLSEHNAKGQPFSYCIGLVLEEKEPLLW